MSGTLFVRTLYTVKALIMDHKHKPQPDPEPRPLGNESTDPFSPTLPPGSLHEMLRQEDEADEGDDAAPKNDDPANTPKK
jgi:hypothetical protein